MAGSLPAAAADRLVKICGLLASNHDGEVVAAARQATKILQSNRLTWSELIGPIVLPRPSPPRPARRQQPHPASPDWRSAARVCLQHPGLFTRWETDFLSNLQGFRRLSAKQAAVLARLHARIQAAGGGAP